MGIAIALLLGVMVAVPWLIAGDPNAQDLASSLATPGADHLLGTDKLGRDLLAQLVYGGRLTLFIGVTGMLVAIVPGTLLNVGSTIEKFADEPLRKRVETPREALERIQADLRNFREACLIVSHDRAFLAATCSQTLDLTRAVDDREAAGHPERIESVQISTGRHGLGRTQYISAWSRANEAAIERAQQRGNFVVGLHLRVGAGEHRNERSRRVT